MTERTEQANVATRQASGSLSLSPLKDWTSDDVWSMLGCMADSSLGFSSPLEPATVARLSDIYRAGNGGVCGVVAGESGARAACGSRFGCAFCGVTGARDKSMEFMVQEPEHAHLKPLNDFRNYLLAIQWDLSRRELVGRTLSDAGYTRIQADTYGFWERMPDVPAWPLPSRPNMPASPDWKRNNTLALVPIWDYHVSHESYCEKSPPGILRQAPNGSAVAAGMA